MAENIVNRVQKRLEKSGDRKFSNCKTKEICLVGGQFKNHREILEFGGVQLGEAKQIGATAAQIQALVERYGRETEKIVELGYQIWPLESNKSTVLKKAELLYCMEEEMAMLPADFWIRRTGGLYFHLDETVQEFQMLEDWFIEQSTYSQEFIKESGYTFLREADRIKSALI